MKEQLFSVKTNPGSGNLSAKAYYASIVGPRRAALGARRKVTLTNASSQKIAANTGVNGVSSVCFVNVTLVPGQTAELILFGSDENPSDDNGIPRVLSTASTGVIEFQAALNPGEILYAALPSTAAAGSSVSLVVSMEWF